MSQISVNRQKRKDQWEADVIESVKTYNKWFMTAAPDAFARTRARTTQDVEAALKATSNLTDIKPELLELHPQVLPVLRMATCPPLAVDRLIGLAGVSTNLVKAMELDRRVPPRMSKPELRCDLKKIAELVEKLADRDLFPWLGRATPATEPEIHNAAKVVSDRYCASVANPIIRNEQEKRQLDMIEDWLTAPERGYTKAPSAARPSSMRRGTFSFRMNVPVKLLTGDKVINIPVDAAIMPKNAPEGSLPIFVEAKSAGDFTNTNKRRKEEAVKMAQLKHTYQDQGDVRFVLFLCGYFGCDYLEYESAEGIDWVWEHRIGDLAGLGL
jgi:hypothetical protein